jgi:hypothetical protein
MKRYRSSSNMGAVQLWLILPAKKKFNFDGRILYRWRYSCYNAVPLSSVRLSLAGIGSARLLRLSYFL